jgi:uncharacterized protein YecT (DUF1311 family)
MLQHKERVGEPLAMHRLFIRIVILSLIAIFGAAAASAQRRVALVIGNSNYVHVPVLANPQNDARAIAEVLERLGFEVVLALDVARQDMARPLSEFSQKLAGADVGLFFYAGHGLSFDGRNYLVPVDATAENHIQVKFEMTAIDEIAEEMARSVRLNIVMLDACRNNPLTARLERSLGASRSSSLTRGLSVMRPVGQESSIVFATAPGEVAADGAGAHSPFTKAVLDHIETPGLTIEAVLRNVRRDVRAATSNGQLPEMWHRLENTFYFNTSTSDASDTATISSQSAGQRGYSPEDDRLYWKSVKDLGDAGLLRSYVEEFPKGRYVAIAERMIARLASEPDAGAQRNAAATDTAPTGQAFRPSFNCEENIGATEQAICGSRTLSELDLRLAALYFETYGRVGKNEGQKLRDEQRAWLKTRNACLADAQCLESAYGQRIDALRNIP